MRLVEKYAESYDLAVVDELSLTAYATPDATLRSYLGLDVGYIENKDIKACQRETDEKVRRTI
ncbi:MAG: hypothetical protein NVSMB49_29290 [Ktedonobacteraceae bacterium]